MSTWEFDVENSARLSGATWHPRYSMSLGCRPNFSEFLTVDVVLTNEMRDLEGDLRRLLRQPWRMFCFNLSGTKWHEKHFLSYLHTNEAMDAAADDTKPADWLKAYPTWTQEGVEYTTDFFSAFKSDRVRVRMHGTMTLFDANGKATLCNGGHELAFLQPHLKTEVDPQQKPFEWSGMYEIGASASSDAFDVEVSQLAEFLAAFGRGIQFPFNLRYLPNQAGFAKVAFEVYVQFELLGALYVKRFEFWSPMKPELPAGDHTYRDLDFSGYDPSRYYLTNSCFTEMVQNRSAMWRTDGQLLTAAFAVTRFVRNMQTVYLREKVTRKETRELLERLINNADRVVTLLRWDSNVTLHHSEGFLQMGEVIADARAAAGKLAAEGVVISAADLDALRYDTALTEVAVNNRVHAAAHLKMDRPLHKDESERYARLQKRMADAQARMRNPEMPAYGAVLIGIAVGIVVSALLLLTILVNRA